MVEDLVEYVQKSVNQGQSIKDIKQELLEIGYSEKEINEACKTALGKSPENSGVHFAKLSERFVVILDHIIVLALFFLFSLILTLIGMGSTEVHGYTWLLIIAFFNLIYFTFFESVNGQTPGKMLAGIKVCCEDGNPIGFGRSLIRNIFRFLDLPFFYSIGIGSILYTAKSQRVGDMIARTVVVKSDSEEKVNTRESGKRKKTLGLIILISGIILLLLIVPAIVVSMFKISL